MTLLHRSAQKGQGLQQSRHTCRAGTSLGWPVGQGMGGYSARDAETCADPTHQPVGLAELPETPNSGWLLPLVQCLRVTSQLHFGAVRQGTSAARSRTDHSYSLPCNAQNQRCTPCYLEWASSAHFRLRWCMKATNAPTGVGSVDADLLLCSRLPTCPSSSKAGADG